MGLVVGDLAALHGLLDGFVGQLAEDAQDEQDQHDAGDEHPLGGLALVPALDARADPDGGERARGHADDRGDEEWDQLHARNAHDVVHQGEGRVGGHTEQGEDQQGAGVAVADEGVADDLGLGVVVDLGLDLLACDAIGDEVADDRRAREAQQGGREPPGDAEGEAGEDGLRVCGQQPEPGGEHEDPDVHQEILREAERVELLRDRVHVGEQEDAHDAGHDGPGDAEPRGRAEAFDDVADRLALLGLVLRLGWGWGFAHGAMIGVIGQQKTHPKVREFRESSSQISSFAIVLDHVAEIIRINLTVTVGLVRSLQPN